MQRISRLWRRSKPLEQEAVSKTLPEHFAEELLNAQLELESSAQVNLTRVNRLVQLYSIAVEYYQSIRSNKYLIFKQKITQLLLNPMVSRTIDETSTQKEQQLRTERGEEIELQTSSQQDRKKELEHNLTFALRNAQGDVRYIIVNANDRRDNLSKMIASGLLEQEFLIRRRLKNRKKNLKIGSRDSTESDSKEQRLDWDDNKESQEASQMVLNSPIAEEDLEESNCSIDRSAEASETQLQPRNLSVPSSSQPLLVQQKNNTDYLLSPEEIARRRKNIANRSRRKLLINASNSSPQQLPGEYSLPF